MKWHMESRLMISNGMTEQQIDQIRERNLFEWQAIQDAIYYSKRLKIVEKDK